MTSRRLPPHAAAALLGLLCALAPAVLVLLAAGLVPAPGPAGWTAGPGIARGAPDRAPQGFAALWLWPPPPTLDAALAAAPPLADRVDRAPARAARRLPLRI